MAKHNIIAGRAVQMDASGGQGHYWRDANEDNIPANVRLEIEGEIIDGQRDSADDFVASNGQHYRWE